MKFQAGNRPVYPKLRASTSCQSDTKLELYSHTRRQDVLRGFRTVDCASIWYNRLTCFNVHDLLPPLPAHLLGERWSYRMPFLSRLPPISNWQLKLLRLVGIWRYRNYVVSCLIENHRVSLLKCRVKIKKRKRTLGKGRGIKFESLTALWRSFRLCWMVAL